MKQANNTSDLVSVATLTKIASRIKQYALIIARTKRSGRVGRLDPIVIGTPKVSQKQISINIMLDTDKVPEAAAFEWGGAGYYEISPINAEFLQFAGTNQYAGKWIKTSLVMHPPQIKRPYLEPAKRLTRQQNLADIRAEVNRNIRLIISVNSKAGKTSGMDY